MSPVLLRFASAAMFIFLSARTSAPASITSVSTPLVVVGLVHVDNVAVWL